MKTARAVIGANFGDEGKGLVTDYLCSRGAGVVVRYNGGAQAGHTVVTPTGERHVFSHFGSGSFLGVPTFLSQFFVCNPILFIREAKQLAGFGLEPTVYAHPNCLVTTFADMMINQHKEKARGGDRHGSCGVGFHETLVRSEMPHLKITMSDLWNRTPLEDRLVEICTKYAEFRAGKAIKEMDKKIAVFTKMAEAVAEVIKPAGIQQCPDPVFEGAQGLLLDQNNKEFYPHVTHSNTGMRNIFELCNAAGIEKIEPYYVSRTYLTRHGAGPLPGEDAAMTYSDETNQPNDWQGALRFAPIDVRALRARCAKDAFDNGNWASYKLVLTHCDQLGPATEADLFFAGPTRDNVLHGKMAVAS